MCVPLWFACVFLPGRRLLRWAEDALRHPLASFQLLQIAICQLLTFILIFLRFCWFPVFVISLFLFLLCLQILPLYVFFVFVKAFVPMCHLLASKMGGHLDFKLLLHVVVLIQHLVGSGIRLERYMIMRYTFIQHPARSPSVFTCFLPFCFLCDAWESQSGDKLSPVESRIIKSRVVDFRPDAMTPN